MDRTSLSSRILSVVLIAALALFSVGFTWAAVDDLAFSDTLPKGAKVSGVDIGGLTRAEATRVVEDQVKAKALAPVTVGFMGSKTTIDPSSYVTMDVGAMLTEAALPKAESPIAQRVWQRVSGDTVGHDVELTVKLDTAALTTWAEAQRVRVTVPAVDASVTVSGSKPEFTAAKQGSTIDVTASVAAISAALNSGAKYVDLGEVKTDPAVTDAKLGKTIIVSTSKKTLVLYNGATVEKSYRCAVGTAAYPTPLGTFFIELKRYRPTWSNPGSAWAAGMPSYIGPGPANPLGTRALNINSPGIRIHGTSKDYSIGTAASHGCMRMHMWDVEELYDLVKVGTRVIIVR